MPDIFNLNDDFSTTRRLIKTEPEFGCFLLYPENAQQGGLRTKALFKCTEINKPLITVVTVVYNGVNFLERTIKSVINQFYDNVEYIIVDGGSTDGTLNIIKKYEHAIDYWVSASDKGIYDAMNKGIDLATGEWICFMNGGDEFFQPSVLAEVFVKPDNSDAQIIVGNQQVIYPSGRTRQAWAGSVKKLWQGSQFCHQATFVKTDYHRANKFNLQTKIVADFEFFYHAWQTRAKFRYADVVVAKFEAGGISDVKRIDAILGFWTVVEKSPSINLYYAFRVILETFKSFLK